MFERFTAAAREVVVQAQAEARRLQHNYIGTEHILLALMAGPETVAGRVLRGLGVEAEAVRSEVTAIVSSQAPAEPDASALDAIGIDLDAVRRRVEEAFGPGALDQGLADRRCRRRGGSRWDGGGSRWDGGGSRWDGGGSRWAGGGSRWDGGGSRWAGGGSRWAGGRGRRMRTLAGGFGHIPFTPRAKKVLELSLREALRLGHNYIGPEHVLLGLLREGQGLAAEILVRRGLTIESIRAQVLEELEPNES